MPQPPLDPAPKRPPGRSPLVALRLPPALLARIDAEAKRRGIARSAAIRRLIEKALGRRNNR